MREVRYLRPLEYPVRPIRLTDRYFTRVSCALHLFAPSFAPTSSFPLSAKPDLPSLFSYLHCSFQEAQETMMAMEDYPLMQPCSNVTTKHVSSSYTTKTEACASNNEMGSYVSWASGGSEECETFDSISLCNRFERRRERGGGAIEHIVEALDDVISQIFDAFVISPADIDCVADVIDEATQELTAEFTEENTESGGFEVQAL